VAAATVVAAASVVVVVVVVMVVVVASAVACASRIRESVLWTPKGLLPEQDALLEAPSPGAGGLRSA
jgi:hypothetical protein